MNAERIAAFVGFNAESDLAGWTKMPSIGWTVMDGKAHVDARDLAAASLVSPPFTSDVQVTAGIEVVALHTVLSAEKAAGLVARASGPSFHACHTVEQETTRRELRFRYEAGQTSDLGITVSGTMVGAHVYMLSLAGVEGKCYVEGTFTMPFLVTRNDLPITSGSVAVDVAFSEVNVDYIFVVERP